MAQLTRRVYYEWDFEVSDEYGDIVDHRHWDKCPGLPTEPNVQLVLVRDSGTSWSDDPDHFELDDRSWAYVKDGTLPTETDSGEIVPKRFHEELRAVIKRQEKERLNDGTV